MCVLGRYVVVTIACDMSSSCCYAEYNVFITLVHTHTQKQKLYLFCEVDVMTNGRFVTYGIREGSTHDLGSLRISLT
jgi:hypothetical protein